MLFLQRRKRFLPSSTRVRPPPRLHLPVWGVYPTFPYGPSVVRPLPPSRTGPAGGRCRWRTCAATRCSSPCPHPTTSSPAPSAMRSSSGRGRGSGTGVWRLNHCPVPAVVLTPFDTVWPTMRPALCLPRHSGALETPHPCWLVGRVQPPWPRTPWPLVAWGPPQSARRPAHDAGAGGYARPLRAHCGGGLGAGRR